MLVDALKKIASDFVFSFLVQSTEQWKFYRKMFSFVIFLSER